MKNENKNTNKNTAGNENKTTGRKDGHMRIDVIGRITNDPEIKEVKKEDKTYKVCSNVAVAVNVYGIEDPIYLRLIFGDDDAERYSKMLRKGMKVSVAGDLRIRKYKKDSETKQQLEIYRVFSLDNIGSYKGNNSESNKDAEGKAEEQKEGKGNKQQVSDISTNQEDDLDDDFVTVDLDDIEDGDLPF